jgi:peptidyl-prolyl cis-trans isomerase B (cyclophilin B)
MAKHVFGHVVSGTDIVDQIEGVKTGRNGFHDDMPKDPIIIEKAVAL